MKTPRISLIAFTALLSACATNVPVPVQCPPPPPVPQSLTSPASTGPSLAERWETLRQAWKDSLQKAQRTP